MLMYVYNVHENTSKRIRKKNNNEFTTVTEIMMEIIHYYKKNIHNYIITRRQNIKDKIR